MAKGKIYKWIAGKQVEVTKDGKIIVEGNSRPADIIVPAVAKPATPKAFLMPSSMYEALFDVWTGDPADIAISKCTKSLTIILTPKGVSEVRNYQNYWAVKNAEGTGRRIIIKNELPDAIYLQVLAFFREVYKEHKGEAIVYIYYYPPTEKDKELWYIEVPEQKVSGASVNAPRATAENLWGEIHSHNTMSAFWSGTDNASEQAEGFINGVIGNIMSKTASWKFRCRAFGEWFDLNPFSEREEDTLPEVPKEWMAKVSSFGSSHGTAYTGYHRGEGGRFDKDNGREEYDYYLTGGNGRDSSSPHPNGDKPLYDDKPEIDAITAATLPPYLRKVLRLDGYVWIEWRKGEIVKSKLTEKDLSESQRKLILEEGKDWKAEDVGLASTSN